MRSHEEIKSSLGAWLDGELAAAEAAEIQLHVQGCASCLGEKARLEKLESSLKNVLETEASQIAFEPFWAGVRRRIAEEKSWRARGLDWARDFLTLPRLAWAIPVAALVIWFGVFSSWDWPFNSTNQAAVESIDGHGYNVALLREAKTKTAVIWVFDNQESEDDSATTPAAAESAF
ncbi:MAG TPA: zf-HC2 domain-containing protein [Candidatus Binatia bacterium]|jgi:anti-sigma factor RsiW